MDLADAAGAELGDFQHCLSSMINRGGVPRGSGSHDDGRGHRPLAAQQLDGKAFFAGVWAIFGHGNVAGLGPALHAMRRKLPTFRAHNEQAMAHAAIAFAKAHARRRMMACTTSIGPGASNMVTAAAAHVNRLPVLLLPGDIFASRRPIQCSSSSRRSATPPHP